MSINIHILTGSKEILPYQDQIQSITESIIASIDKSSLIKDADLVFCFNPNATSDKMGGIGISSTNSYSIVISLDPLHKNFNDTIREQLKSLLIKELKDNGFIK
jgi:hypothetical protein